MSRNAARHAPAIDFAASVGAIEVPKPPRIPRELHDAVDLSDWDRPTDVSVQEERIDFDAVVRASSLPPRPESGIFRTERGPTLAPPDLVPPDAVPPLLTSPPVAPAPSGRATLLFAVVGVTALTAAVSFTLGRASGRAEWAPLVAAPSAAPVAATSDRVAAPALAPRFAAAPTTNGVPLTPSPKETSPTAATPAPIGPSHRVAQTDPAPTAATPRHLATTLEPSAPTEHAHRELAAASAAPRPAAAPEDAGRVEPSRAAAAPPRGEGQGSADVRAEAAPGETAVAVTAEAGLASAVADATGGEPTAAEDGAAVSDEASGRGTVAELAPATEEEEPTADEAVAATAASEGEATDGQAVVPPARSLADLFPEAPPTPRALPVRPSPQEVRQALAAVAPRVRACGDGSASIVSVRVRIGGDGSVRRALPEGALSSEAATCVQSAVSAARFPEFSGTELNVSYPFRL